MSKVRIAKLVERTGQRDLEGLVGFISLFSMFVVLQSRGQKFTKIGRGREEIGGEMMKPLSLPPSLKASRPQVSALRPSL